MALVLGSEQSPHRRRGVCLPFTDFCDPLLFRGCDSSMASKLSANSRAAENGITWLRDFYNDRKNYLKKGSTEMAER